MIEQLREARQGLGTKLLAPGAVQTNDVQPLLLRIGQLRDNLALDRAQAVLEVRAVLTPHQIARAAQVMEERRHVHAIPTLIRQLDEERDEFVRAAVLAALGTLESQ